MNRLMNFCIERDENFEAKEEEGLKLIIYSLISNNNNNNNDNDDDDDVCDTIIK